MSDEAWTLIAGSVLLGAILRWLQPTQAVAPRQHSQREPQMEN
jgi:hypothetical protein